MAGVSFLITALSSHIQRIMGPSTFLAASKGPVKELVLSPQAEPPADGRAWGLRSLFRELVSGAASGR